MIFACSWVDFDFVHTRGDIVDARVDFVHARG